VANRRVTNQLRIMRRSLSTLDRALRLLSSSMRRLEKSGTGRAVRRKLNLSPSRRAALKLQGRYMGYVRKLGAKQKARVKAIRAEKGIHAAIAMARRAGRA
jgi:hypothetical protein